MENLGFISVPALLTYLRQAEELGLQSHDVLAAIGISPNELTEHYLLCSELPIQDIGSYLGFSEARSFHRSFKGWTGMPPGEYRERHKAG